LVEVTDAPIVPEKAIELVRRQSYGGVISYVGTVRESSNGRRVLHFGHHESWSEIARTELEGIVEEIRVRWGLKDVAVLHRTGTLEPGEVLLVVAVGAPHREEAFEACRYAIDRYKEASSPWIVEHTAEA
jgi:molybdopterin synthase catalytic subunit